MSDYQSNPISISLYLNGGKGQGPPSGESQNTVPLIRSQSGESIGPTRNGPYSPICALNDDVLLNIFDVYRLADPDEYEDENGEHRIDWYRKRWWYNLAHVCRLWRNLILVSPSRLGLHLVCMFRVHVADMLAHSPPLPLVIYYHIDQGGITAKDESSMLLALSHRNRMRRISLDLPNSELRKFVMAMDGQFPILERLFIVSPFTWISFTHNYLGNRYTQAYKDRIVQLSPPQSFSCSAFSYAPPGDARDGMVLPIPKLCYEERCGPYAKNNLHSFVFLGLRAYLEDLVSRISAPSLSILKSYSCRSSIDTFSGSHLLRFMQTSEDLRFNTFKRVFSLSQGSLNFEAIYLRGRSPFCSCKRHKDPFSGR
jgi:hypothetical protein